jgi:prepilin-type N-terminal cleavage/methylation domain-containing protein
MKRSRECRKTDIRGFTLVELIATFALLSIFITAAAVLISSTAKAYYEARGTSDSFRVSEILFDQIAGELERAQPADFEDADGNRVTMDLYQDAVEYVDEAGRTARLGLYEENGATYLEIAYASENADSFTRGWSFDEKTYMGFYLKSLQISKASGDYLDNVLRVDLVLYSSGYGEYAFTRYISCYRFDTEDAAGSVEDARTFNET